MNASITHVVAAPDLRAQIAQREHGVRYPRGTFLPYVHDAFDSLPQCIAELVDAGHPRSAEYWLLQAERAAGVISADAFQRCVTELGSFHLHSRDHRCGCAPAACLS